MTHAGSEHGPFAAPLHNRIRRRTGLKNPWIGNNLPSGPAADGPAKLPPDARAGGASRAGDAPVQ